MTHWKISEINQPQMGQLIREIRLTTGLTQEQFAAALGVVSPTVNRWENGHTFPSPLALKGIERKLIELGETSQSLWEKYKSEERSQQKNVV